MIAAMSAGMVAWSLGYRLTERRYFLPQILLRGPQRREVLLHFVLASRETLHVPLYGTKVIRDSVKLLSQCKLLLQHRIQLVCK